MTTPTDMEKQPLLQQERQLEQEHQPEESSLGELQQNVWKAQRAYLRAWSRTTSGKWHKCIMFCVSAFLVLFMVFCIGVIVDDHLSDEDEGWRVSGRVPLEAHIMSKCPDAKDCLHDMILPAMQNVSDKVDFRLSYIGITTDDDEDGDGVICKHGQEECLGNMIELCAAHLYPDPKIYLGFVMCLTRDYQEIPKRELVEDCALEHSISMDKMNDCLTEDDGAVAIDMLKASFNRTIAAGVTKSCTVRLNGQIRCIRDGGEWKDCEGGSKPEDLVADIIELSSLDWY